MTPQNFDLPWHDTALSDDEESIGNSRRNLPGGSEHQLNLPLNLTKLYIPVYGSNQNSADREH